MLVCSCKCVTYYASQLIPWTGSPEIQQLTESPSSGDSQDISPDGRFVYITLTNANHTVALDISDLDNVKRLDDPAENQPAVGPHYVKVTPDQKNLVVIDYFLQTGDIGLVNVPGDYRVLYIDLNADGSMRFNRSIDVNKKFASRGGARPHACVVFDLTDPENPRYR